jgi:hypothetical protein
MHLLLSIATLAAATTEDSSSSSSSSCKLRAASSTHQRLAFLPSSMRSSPTTSTMIHEYNDEPTPHSLLHQSYDSGGLGAQPNEPSSNSMDSSVFFMMDELSVQQQQQQQQSHPSTSSCSPNEERMCYMDVEESTLTSPPLPILPLGWVLPGRGDSKEKDDRDRALISLQAVSPQTTRSTGRTTNADDKGGARTSRPERTTTTVTAGRHQQGHDFTQQQQQSSPTHRLSFMVSNSLLWMVSMVRNAVLA